MRRAYFPSFKITVPLLILTFSALLALGYLYYTLPKASQAIETRYIRNLYQTLSALQGSLEYLFRKNDIEGVRREVAAIASNPENQLISVLNENDQVIASTRLGWVNRSINELSQDFDHALALQAQQRLKAYIHLTPDRQALIGYSPINLGAKLSQLRPTRVGLLFFKKDLSQAKHRSKAQILNQSYYWLGFVAVLAGVMGLIFHYLVTRRVDSLLKGVRSLTEEDSLVRVELRGNDELTRLATAFNQMTDKIRESQTQLQQDIARRKTTESDLRESETRMSQILNNTLAVVYVKDLDGTLLFGNQHFATLFNLKNNGFLGQKDHDVLPRQVFEQFNESDQFVLENQQGIQLEEDAYVKNRMHSYLVNKFPLLTAQGDMYALCTVATDISDRKQAERVLESAALAVSEASGEKVFEMLTEKLGTLMATGYALIGVISGSDQIKTVALCVNGEIVDNISYDLAGSPCETVVNQKFRFYPDQIIQRFPNDQLLVDINVESYAAMPLFDSTGQALGLIAILDSSPLKNRALIESIIRIFAARAAGELERNKFDKALLESEVSYRSLFNATEDSVFIHDSETGAILDVNAKACETYGYTVDEFRKISIGDISSGVHPYTEQRAAEILQTVEEGKLVRFEWHRKNKDGSLHWDEVCAKKTVIASQPRFLVFTRDISERKQAEEQRLKLEAQLRQAQKMEAIGQLTGGIAHDFNNILASVLGNAELSLERASSGNDPKLKKYLHNISRAGERGRDLIQQMLTFSRGGHGEPRTVALVPLIEETVKMLQSTLPSSMELRTDTEFEAAYIHSDPVLVEQVIMNLYINARDAMNGVGAVTISLQKRHHQNALCTGCKKVFSGDFVEMTVKDSGSGIEAKQLDRIFEPFYTTKQVGRGTGMGLAMVHGITHEHGGHIIVESAPEKGSAFHILFPEVEQQDANEIALKQPSSNDKIRTFSASILVIDDEELVAEYMCDLLQSRGMQATLMTDCEQALTLFNNDPSQFDLVITDQTMPKYTGAELSVKLLQIDPSIPIILYTGHSENLSEEFVYHQGIKAYLKKPVNTEDLMETIWRLLTGG